MDSPEQPGAAGANRFHRRLRTEVASWREDGLITEEQAAAILARYRPDASSVAANPLGNRVVTIVAVMGATLIGLGIIAWIAANWSEIAPWGRLSIMAVATPVIYAIGWFLAYRRGYPVVGTEVILLGAIAFGAAIHLIAQTYHVPVNHPNLVAAWFLGVIPIAYLTRSRTAAGLMLILFLAAAGFRAQEWFPEFDDAALFAMPPVYLALAGALFGMGMLQGRYAYTRPLSLLFVITALLVAGAAIYVLSFSVFWEEVAYGYAEGIPPVWPRGEYWAVMGVAGIVAVASTLAWNRRAPASAASRIGELAPILAAGIVIAITMLALALGLGWMWWVFNLIMLGYVSALIAVGYRMLRAELINFAVVLFAVTLFTRYVEFGLELLGQAMAFIVTGLLLLALGFGLELLRRRMLQRMRAPARPQ